MPLVDRSQIGRDHGDPRGHTVLDILLDAAKEISESSDLSVRDALWAIHHVADQRVRD